MRIGFSGELRAVSEGTAKRFGGDGGSVVKKGVRSATWHKEQRRLCYLYIREQGATLPVDNSALLVFSVNPKSFVWEQTTKLGVQYTRNGYNVLEGGLNEPRFVIEGHHGWKLMRPVLPDYLKLEVQQKGKNSPISDPVARDGFEKWHLVRSLIERYINANQRRALEGKKLLELVWADPIHGSNDGFGLRWVVTVPSLPSLRHNVETQALLNYRIEFVGIRDDLAAAKAPIRIPNLTPAAGPTFKPAATATDTTDSSSGDDTPPALELIQPVPKPGGIDPAKPTYGPPENYEFRFERLCVFWGVWYIAERYRAAKLDFEVALIEDANRDPSGGSKGEDAGNRAIVLLVKTKRNYDKLFSQSRLAPQQPFNDSSYYLAPYKSEPIPDPITTTGTRSDALIAFALFRNSFAAFWQTDLAKYLSSGGTPPWFDRSVGLGTTHGIVKP